MNQSVTANQAATGARAATGNLAAAAHQVVVTGEAVTIDLRLARLGSRMIATLVDLAIEGTVLFTVFVVAAAVVQPDDEALAVAVSILVYVGVVVGYPVACETLLRGRTVGKMVMGLRVVRDDGGPIRFRHAFTRGLVGAVVERPGFLLALPAIISMLASSRSKRLGDIFAGTVVLQESVPRTTGTAPSMPPALEGWAALLDLTGLDDDLAFAVRRFLGRAWEMSPQARDAVGSQLLGAVRGAVTPAPPPGTPGWAYLSAVLAERTRRAYLRLTSTAYPYHQHAGHAPAYPYQHAGRAPVPPATPTPATPWQPGAVAGPWAGGQGHPPRQVN